MRRRTWALPAAAVVLAAGGVVVLSSAEPATPAAQEPSANTMEVEKGPLAAMVSLNGTLRYGARADGSSYSAINRARGIYTRLPAEGDKVGCGGVFYRVDDDPVLLLCGTVPAYRDLRIGDRGPDVRQLNRNLHTVGSGNKFTAKTKKALKQLQHRRHVQATGTLELGDAVVLPRAVRIAKVTGELGAPARPGAQIAQATSRTLGVQVDLDASQRGDVKSGDRAQITLPGNMSVKGKVDRLGTVARTAGKDDAGGEATIPLSISLDEPVRGLDQAPVQVEITTEGVASALSVPVTALVGKSGGGLAVEVVRGDRRELVAVTVGLFDDAHGRVQVEGDLREGESVVVPSL